MDENREEAQGNGSKPKGRETREVTIGGRSFTMYVPSTGATTAAMATMRGLERQQNAGQIIEDLERLLRLFVGRLFVNPADRRVIDEMLYSEEVDLPDLLAIVITGKAPDQTTGNREQRRQQQHRSGGRGRGRN